jgi:hypothetical protein
MKRPVRPPTTFLTRAELEEIAGEKVKEAEHMPQGVARNEVLASANLYQRLGELRGRIEAEKSRMN